MTSVHVCEPPAPLTCNDAGIVFIRDAYGYGHWVCPAHRNLPRDLYPAPTYNEEAR